MQTVLDLFKFQIDERTDFLKSNKRKKVYLKAFLYICLIAALTAVITLVFSRLITIGYYVDSRLFAFLLLATQFISVILSMGAIFKTLYFNKDNDLLMSMPCSHNQLFFSKLLVIYFFELVANAIYTIPIFISYAIIVGEFSIFFLICMPIFLLILPLFPLSLATLISVPLMLIINYLKNHPKLMIICTILITALFFALYMLLVFKITNMLDFTGAQSEIVIGVDNIISRVVYYSWYFQVMADAMLFLHGWWWKLLVILGIIAFIFSISLLLIKHYFFVTAMKNYESKLKSITKPRTYKVDKPFISLIKKEFLSAFRSPGYIFEFFTFSLLMPFIVLTYDKLLGTITVNHTGVVMIAASHVLIISILAMLSNVSSASTISREGSNFYWTKITPVSYKTQCLAKISFNAIITIISLIVTAIISLLFTDIAPQHIICGTIAVIIASIGHIVLSFLLDLKKPTLNWYDSSEIDKISKTTTLSMVIGLIISFLLFCVVFLFAPTKHTIWPWSIIILTSSVFTFIVILTAHFKIKKYFVKAGE